MIEDATLAATLRIAERIHAYREALNAARNHHGVQTAWETHIHPIISAIPKSMKVTLAGEYDARVIAITVDLNSQ